jgi:serine protease
MQITFKAGAWLFHLILAAATTFGGAVAQPSQPVLPGPNAPIPVNPEIQQGDEKTTTIVSPPYLSPAKPTLTARKLHAKPGHAVYWKGLYTDRVVVKLEDEISVDLRSGPASGAKTKLALTFLQDRATGDRVAREINAINGLIAEDTVVHFRSLFSADRQTIQARRTNAEIRTSRAHSHLENYFLVVLKPGTSAEAVADRLNALSTVEIAYLPPIPQTPDIPPATPDFEGSQGYLDSAAEGGIDARFAWTRPGGHGSGMRVIDVEAGWNLDHEDLPPPFLALAIGGGLNAPGWINDDEGKPANSHGTSVLGIMLAKNDGRGVTGIATAAAYNVVSVIRPLALVGTLEGYLGMHHAGVADAVNAAAGLASPGDVIVIEQHSPGPPTQTSCPCNCGQFEYVPMEFFAADFDAIQNATSNGIVVVEAAGNGSVDLDSPVYGDRFNRDAHDSGAILVGASSSTSRAPLCFTNFGSRIDLHGWGEHVMTTGLSGSKADDIKVNGDDQNQFYTRGFNGTSSATPIVAGAVLSLQGTLKAGKRDLLTPAEMRKILAETGTPQDTPVTRKIGPLPNLRAAIARLGTATPSAGGGGGDAFALDCGPGEMLTGVRGRAGWYIDQVRAVCKNGAGVLIESGARGGNGGTPFDSQCNSGQGVTGIVGFAGAFVDSFRLECKSAPAGTPDGDVSLTPSIGGSQGQAFGPFHCDEGQVAVGLRGRAGDFIDNLQLDCATVALDLQAAKGWISPAAGGSGGSHFELSCDTNEVLVGVIVETDNWLNDLRGHCVSVSPDGSWLREPGATSRVGKPGWLTGTEVTQDCPSDSAIFEIAGRADWYVDRLAFRCRPLETVTTVNGASTKIGPFGGNGGEPFGPYTCPSGLAATGLQGNSGDYIDRIQLRCGQP